MFLQSEHCNQSQVAIFSHQQLQAACDISWVSAACLWLQLRLAERTGNLLKQREYHWRSAEAFDRLGEFTDAEEQLKLLLAMELTKEQYLETLCHLADIQVCSIHMAQHNIVPHMVGPHELVAKHCPACAGRTKLSCMCWYMQGKQLLTVNMLASLLPKHADSLQYFLLGTWKDI